MRTVRLSLSLIALALALALSGCGSAPTSQHTTLSNAVGVPAALTPTAPPQQPPAVAANPTHLIIPAIGINAFIESVGPLSNGEMATPTQHPWDDTGWYNLGHSKAMAKGFISMSPVLPSTRPSLHPFRIFLAIKGEPISI